MMLRRFGLIMIFGCAVAMLMAGGFDSAFEPEIGSDIVPSCLLDGNPFRDAEPISGPYGLSHPFQSGAKFGDAVVDLFRGGPPRYALLQYNFADHKLSLRSELNFLAGYDHRWEEDTNYGFLWKGIKFQNRINRHFYANALWWNGAFLNNREAGEQFSPLINGYFTHTPTQTRTDKLTAELGYTDAHLNLSIGRGRAEIGNNISSSIVLSNKVNDYGQLRAEILIGAFGMSFMHGSLVADTTHSLNKYADQGFVDKYVAVHEVSWRPARDLKLFGGELIIYGHRGVDINYFLPHTFWRVIEHNQHDRDNVLIYGGAEAQIGRHLNYWLTAAFDEMSYDKLLSSWWGNKWAVQSGFAWQPKEKGRVAIEISAVRPWTYTHYQNHTMYSHDGCTLGYSDGSNLVKGSLEVGLPLIDKLGWSGRASFMRQGSEGSSWQLNYQDYFTPDNFFTAETKWFAGSRQDTFSWDQMLKIGPFAHHNFYLGHSYKDNAQHKHKLWVGWQAWY